MTPYNLKNDAEISFITPALDGEIQEISREILNAGILYNIDSLPANVLDFLAVQFHVDFYDIAADITMKRGMIKNSLIWHSKKGTSAAIIQALKFIGIDGEFLHWHDTGGEPYTFKIKAHITGDFYRTVGRDEIIKRIRKAVNESKAARSFMKELITDISFSENLPVFVAGFPLLSGHEIISLARYDFNESGKIFAGVASGRLGQEKLFPDRDKKITQNIFGGVITLQNISQGVSLDLDMLQELLLRLENRIFSRLETHEKNISLKLQQQDELINAKFQELMDLLTWKTYEDFDEEI